MKPKELVVIKIMAVRENAALCKCYLSCADIAGSLVSSDVLLTCLKCQAVTWLALSIPANICQLKIHQVAKTYH